MEGSRLKNFQTKNFPASLGWRGLVRGEVQIGLNTARSSYLNSSAGGGCRFEPCRPVPKNKEQLN